MSKLIVEMEMPTRCGACKCRYVEIGRDYFAVFCAIKDNEYVEDPDSIPSWCPIKGVLPEEHGDLIDRNKLLKDIEMYHVSDGRFQHWVELQDAVIAAERKSE